MDLLPKKHSEPPGRKPRDAQENRDRILEVAKAAFTRSGADASLDEIAKQVDVGPGPDNPDWGTRFVINRALTTASSGTDSRNLFRPLP